MSVIVAVLAFLVWYLGLTPVVVGLVRRAPTGVMILAAAFGVSWLGDLAFQLWDFTAAQRLSALLQAALVCLAVIPRLGPFVASWAALATSGLLWVQLPAWAVADAQIELLSAAIALWALVRVRAPDHFNLAARVYFAGALAGLVLCQFVSGAAYEAAWVGYHTARVAGLALFVAALVVVPLRPSRPQLVAT